MSLIQQFILLSVISIYCIYSDNNMYYRNVGDGKVQHAVKVLSERKCIAEYFSYSRSRSLSPCSFFRRSDNSYAFSDSNGIDKQGLRHVHINDKPLYRYETEPPIIATPDFQDNLIQGYRSLIADIQIRTQKSREDMDTLVSQIKLLMKNEADKAINYMTVYLEQISLYFQVIIHDRKPRNGTHCKESIVKLLGENLQLADENVTLCLALGYQRVQRLPEKLNVHFETLDNLKKYSASKLFECQKQQQTGANCSHESQDLERTVFLYETSPFPVVMAEIAIHGFKEVSDLSVCLKDIISRMMTHSVKVIGDFNRCIHNIEMPKLKYLLKFMKKYA